MLKLLTDKMPDVPSNTPFGCKILSAASAYGLSQPFEQFWMQEGGTVVARIDDEAVLLEGQKTDTDELFAFLRTLDLKQLCCPLKTAEHVGLPISSCGDIMVLHPENIVHGVYADTVINPSPRDIYTLLEQVKSENFPVPEFEAFYMDLSFRTRHGTALSAGVYQGGRLASCAVCTAITDDAAVIAAVACVPGLRRHGYGHAAVSTLAEKLNRHNMFIFRMQGENEAFYNAIGFEPYDYWASSLFPIK